MDHVVKIKKGLDIQLEGIPSPKISNTPDSQLYAIIPDDFVGLTPKVIVKPGEKVLTGSPVIHDKTHSNIVVTSPVSGEIVTIERGERRKVIKITIKPDDSQQALEFRKFDLENIDSYENKTLKMKSTIYSYIKQQPYENETKQKKKTRLLSLQYNNCLTITQQTPIPLLATYSLRHSTPLLWPPIMPSFSKKKNSTSKPD